MSFPIFSALTPEELEEFVKEQLSVYRIHHSVGVYRSGEVKRNGVDPEHLREHIAYNLEMRPGRTFFINGKCLNKGYLEDYEIAVWECDLKDMPPPPLSDVYV